MSLKERLRVVLMCTVLQIGVLGGVPMRPDEIRELMRTMNQPGLAHMLPCEGEEGDELP